VPKSAATATAALTALLAGPTDKERNATPRLRTAIPAGTHLRDVRISAGTATVDLSANFAPANGGSIAARLAQVVYTLTQFSSVDRVRFLLDGDAATIFRSEGVVLAQPTNRTAFRDLLPEIFVDRPAWGAAYASGTPITGIANVFEAQFRIAIRDKAGHVLADEAVLASCGTGCWGTFDIHLDYAVASAQWGSLRVWDISERDGTVIDLREYPIYLRP
jgi:germination protein M